MQNPNADPFASLSVHSFEGCLLLTASRFRKGRELSSSVDTRRSLFRSPLARRCRNVQLAFDGCKDFLNRSTWNPYPCQRPLAEWSPQYAHLRLFPCARASPAYQPGMRRCGFESRASVSKESQDTQSIGQSVVSSFIKGHTLRLLFRSTATTRAWALV